MRTRTWILISALIVLIAAGGFLLWYYNRPSADVGACTTVSVYTDYDYSNDHSSACLAVGSYTRAQLITAGIRTDEQISSIKVPTGYVATLYSEDNFGASGLVREIFKDERDLRNVPDVPQIVGRSATSWDNKAQSIKVVAAPNCKVSLYSSADYGGVYACLAAGDYTMSDLTRKGFFGEDKISSFKVPVGQMITLFRGESLNGESQTFIGEIDDLGDAVIHGGNNNRDENDWNDETASIKVATQDCFVSVYDRVENNGISVCLPVGRYTKENLIEKFVGDDKIRSLYIAPGTTSYKAILYDRDNFVDDPDIDDDVKEITASTTDLGVWKDKAASLVIEAVGSTPSELTLTANPTTILNGASSVLTWANASATCVATPATTPPWFNSAASGTATVTPTTTTTYKLVCGATTKEVVVTVSMASLTLTAKPTTINSGASSVLTWANATKPCTATPTGWFTDKTAGTVTVKPTKTTTYKLSCGGIVKEVKEVVVTVKTSTVTPTEDEIDDTSNGNDTDNDVAAGTGDTTEEAITDTNTGTSGVTTRSATTGPETPLVAGGALTLIFASYFLVKRYLG